MATKTDRPKDDVSQAPESGTIRDETSGNQPAHPHERGVCADEKGNRKKCDDTSHAGEER